MVVVNCEEFFFVSIGYPVRKMYLSHLETYLVTPPPPPYELYVNFVLSMHMYLTEYSKATKNLGKHYSN